MKYFLLSSGYQPTVNVDLTPPIWNKPISKRTFKNDELLELFRNQNKQFLAFRDIQSAQLALYLCLKAPNTPSDTIEPGISRFASQVIYEVDLNENLEMTQEINGEKLASYLNPTNIPLKRGDSKEFTARMIDSKYQKIEDGNMLKGSYLEVNNLRCEVLENKLLKDNKSTLIVKNEF